MNDQEDPITEYLIVNEEFLDQMSLGKCCAQVSHAAQMLQERYGKLEKRYDKYLASNEQKIDANIDWMDRYYLYHDWLSEGIRKVVLKADRKEWVKLKEEYKDAVLITDAGHTQLEPGSETVIGLWPQRKSQRSKLLTRLQVL